MSIIKRKKQNRFFQMSNKSAQEDLENLASIGLLAYIISLPEDFRLYKTQLQSKFTRRTVDGAFKELVQKRYIAGFSCYIKRRKQYFYIASDEALTAEEFAAFIRETIEEQGELKNIKTLPDSPFEIPSEFTAAQNVQYKECSTESAEQNVHVQRNKPKDKSQTNKKKESVNTNAAVIQSLFFELGEGLFSKEDILYFTEQILSEVNEEVKFPRLYFSSVVEMIVSRRKKKLGLQPETPFYNWLEN